MDLRTIPILLICAAGVVFFFLRLRYLSRHSDSRKRILQEKEFFLANFNPSTFTDFDNFTFELWSFSHVGPFPTRNDGVWVYTVYLTGHDCEDIGTIVHELTECTVGRLIERLLMLERPLYLIRKQDGKFWLSGQQQKYLPEHIIATLSELDDIPEGKLNERIAPQDVQAWQLWVK